MGSSLLEAIKRWKAEKNCRDIQYNELNQRRSSAMQNNGSEGTRTDRVLHQNGAPQSK